MEFITFLCLYNNSVGRGRWHLDSSSIITCQYVIIEGAVEFDKSMVGIVSILDWKAKPTAACSVK
jgi:hypothetical protein